MFPQDGCDRQLVRGKCWRCCAFPQRFRWLKCTRMFPLCFRNADAAETYYGDIFSLDRNVQGRFHCISAMRMRRKLIMEKFFSRLKCTRTFPLHFRNTDAAETYGNFFLSWLDVNRAHFMVAFHAGFLRACYAFPRCLR